MGVRSCPKCGGYTEWTPIWTRCVNCGWAGKTRPGRPGEHLFGGQPLTYEASLKLEEQVRERARIHRQKYRQRLTAGGD